MMNSYNMMGGWGFIGGFGMLSMLIFWILLIVGPVLLVVWLMNQTNTLSRPAENPTQPPLEILKKRYALGEISKEEFEETKKDLL